MDPQIDSKPGKREVEAQLGRLLNSHRLARSPSQSAVLEVLIKMHLTPGSVINDKTVGKKAFPGYIAGRSSDVRVTVSSLRDLLSEYYADEGYHDLVIIEVLKGRGFPVRFSYNPLHNAVKFYETALGCMSVVNSYPWEVLGALNCCRLAIKADPNFSPAYSLFSEFMLCFASNRFGEITDYGYGPYRGKRKLKQDIGLAREYAIRSVRMNRKHWRGYVALGAYRACCGKWEGAERAFRRAMEISSSETVKDPWYCFYLVATGKVNEATAIAVEMFHATPRGSCWASLVALFHYASGRFYSPFLIVAGSDNSRHPGYLARAVEACCLLAAKDAVQGMELFNHLMLHEKIDGEYNPVASFGLWGLLCARAGETDRAMALLSHVGLCNEVSDVREQFRISAEVSMISDPETFPSAFDRIYGSESGNRLKREACPWELGLICLGLGMHKDAVEELKRAQQEHHPMMMWLHIWDFLRPLYMEPGFFDLFVDWEFQHATDVFSRALAEMVFPGGR